MHCKSGPYGAGIAADYFVVVRSTGELEYHRRLWKQCLGSSEACNSRRDRLHSFRSCNNTLTVEHNGEIYNYKQIRRKLLKHHEFDTLTDSEVIVHLLGGHFAKSNDLIYAMRKTVAELDGVYVLAIKDEVTGTIALVRDKIGIPSLLRRKRYFSSLCIERKALWKIGLRAYKMCFARTCNTYQINWPFAGIGINTCSCTIN